MRCNYGFENIADLFDESTDRARREEILSHTGTCSDCSEEYEKMKRVMAQIKPGIPVRASETLKDRVIQRIRENERQTKQNKRRILFMMNPTMKKVAAIAAVVIIALVMIPVVSHFGWADTKARAANALLEKSIKAMAGLVTVYMDFDVRTTPGDNFEYIDIRSEFVNHKLWRVFGDPGQWRIEKEGRVVVMDGKRQYLYIRGLESAIVAGTDAGFVEWMRIFLDPQKILETEKSHTGKNKASYKTEETGNTIILTVKAKAAGDFTNDYLLNSSITESNSKRIYTFDKATKRLTSFEIYVESGNKEIQVIKMNSIQYDLNIPSATFVIDLPENVKWVEAKKMTGGNSSGITATDPEEVARLFFTSLGKEDWQMVDKLIPGLMQSGNAAQIKEIMGGLKIISLGKAFKSGQYPGVFVPYEIKFRSGETKKFNLAIRNDNPGKKWTVDGGF
jgi:outer membrane lipoprotein-sorting protein